MTRVSLARPREFDVCFRDGTSVRLRLADVVVVWVLGLEEYGVDFSLIGNVQSVLDLGANVGLAAIYLARKLDAKRIVCVEPAPESFRLLVENLRRNVPRASVSRAAVVATSGSYVLSPGEFPGETRVEEGIGEIRGLTVNQVLDEFGIEAVDLLKIDIEGGEIAVFDDVEAWGPRVGAILGEVHPPLTVEQAHAQLASAGFEALPVPAKFIFDSIIFMRRRPLETSSQQRC